MLTAVCQITLPTYVFAFVFACLSMLKCTTHRAVGLHIIAVFQSITNLLNPKKAGSFDPISQPGGGAGFHPTPPLGSRPRSGEKLCNLAHTQTMSRRLVSRNFYTENQSIFQIMQAFGTVNFMTYVYIFNYI